MNSKNHIVSICANVCVTSLSVVARNRRMLLYKLNGDGQILEKPKYIILKKQPVTIKLLLAKHLSSKNYCV